MLPAGPHARLLLDCADWFDEKKACGSKKQGFTAEAEASDEQDAQQLRALAPTLGTPFPKAEDLTNAHPAVKGIQTAWGLGYSIILTFGFIIANLCSPSKP